MWTTQTIPKQGRQSVRTVFVKTVHKSINATGKKKKKPRNLRVSKGTISGQSGEAGGIGGRAETGRWERGRELYR